jgi:histidinol-phosphate aminotransferase
VAPAPGADGVVDCLAQALLDPGDEIVCGWPSFPSYVLDALKLGAVPRTVPLRDHRYDLDAILGAVGPRTKIVYVCYPNNPTGTTNTRAELDAYFERVPDGVVTVVDQAYFEYVTDPDYADAVDYLKAGRRVVVLRTFSKIYGLAGLRVGYGVGPADLVTAIGKVRRAFDLSAPAQVAALASLGDDQEVARRRRLNEESRADVERSLREHGFEIAAPAVANFVYADAGGDARSLFDALLRQGVIVRPLASFGAPEAIRVTVGTPEENAFFAEALAAHSLVA